MVSDLLPGGAFLLNCGWDLDEIERHLPAADKRYIAKNNIRLYTIDGVSIARELGLGGRINTILQAAFFKIANIIPVDDAVKYMKDAATASYGKKGEKIVAMNHAAIERGIADVQEIPVPAAWADAQDEPKALEVNGDRPELVEFVKNVLIPVNAQQGDKLPVSTFKDTADGTFPQGSAAYEKRGIAVDVPEWQPENCIQCNFCSYVCPHAVVRPIVLTEQEAADAPEGMKKLPMTGMPGYQFAITVSVLDCTGCGSCANVCPGKKGEKALVMKPLDTQLAEQEKSLYGIKLPEKEEVAAKFKPETVKGSQFIQPLLEFHGACPGCGETPYAKLATQIAGERMYIANATGCSSIWGGSAPSTPYTVGKNGFGPAWANSLFEDNAEYGFGMFLAQETLRKGLIAKVEEIAADAEGDLKAACDAYLSTLEQGKANGVATRKLIAALEACGCDKAKAILKDKEYLSKKSVWMFGGDGWAYDIGFGGLDHVIAANEDVNILVFDTEVYSNTGGQSSKATPTGAVAQFAAAGKEVKKKDLAAIAMSYGYVYVAQVAMGADYNQCMKAFIEAESYNGPSLILAYAPCINHGLKGGMSQAQTEIKNAVAAGYWHNFRYDPRLAQQGKNPFQLDSKAPSLSYEDFINSEVRYTALTRSFPERAERLFEAAAKTAEDKYARLVKLAKSWDAE